MTTVSISSDPLSPIEFLKRLAIQSAVAGVVMKNDNSKPAKTDTMQPVHADKMEKKTYEKYFLGEDFVILFGELEPGLYSNWLSMFRKYFKQEAERNKNVTVLISTPGGSADDAFRMMRFLQNSYEKITVVIVGCCYSAGTLFALGADKILMSEGGNLGPLDVQVRREDDLSRMSGESYRQALMDLSTIAQIVFRENFSHLKLRRDILLSTATASKIASEMAIGMVSPIVGQIEPVKLGEMMRYQLIAESYGKRLMHGRYTVSDINKALGMLTSGYPSHGTVIDSVEAQKLGLHVEEFDITKYIDGHLLIFERDMVDGNYPNEPKICIANKLEIAE